MCEGIVEALDTELLFAIDAASGDADARTMLDTMTRKRGAAMERVRSQGRPFTKLDILHRENLDVILPDFGIDPADLIRLVGRVRDAPPHAAVDNDLLAARLEHLATKRSWLAGRDVVAAVADASPSGLPAPVVERVAHTLGTAVAEHDGRALAQLTQLAQSPQPTLSRVSAQEPRWVAADVVRTVRSQFDPLVSSLDRIGGDSAVAERARAPVPRADRAHERAERARWDRLGPRTLDR